MARLAELLLCGCTSSELCKPEDKSAVETKSERQKKAGGGSSPSSPCKASSKAKIKKAKQEGDDIDKELCAVLKEFNQDASSSLKVRRVGDGEYDIDGRRVRLCWTPASMGAGRELIVQEGGQSDEDTTDTPLTTYLQQAVAVAASLHGRAEGSPVVARVPADKRMTFVAPSKVSDDPSIERVRSMQVACEQARLREHAAEAYESSRTGKGPPLSRGNTPTSFPHCTVSGGSRAPTPPPGSPSITQPVLQPVSSMSRAPTPPRQPSVSVAGTTVMRLPPAPPVQVPRILSSTSGAQPASGSFPHLQQQPPFGSSSRTATPPGTQVTAPIEVGSTGLLRRGTPPLGSFSGAFSGSRPGHAAPAMPPKRANSPSMVLRQNTPDSLLRQNTPPVTAAAHSRGRSPAVQAVSPAVGVQTVQRQQTR
eukprot:TRINITY_DN87207_c0_g1_i1.p1 TRINITY_DN87207_c0_g1~~TRINITY_DN87207_c0_g1_i1.p1  ORF type:complete len:422 (-),score=59.44 TRINITY_DN87207_c0_g1_i1:58-1323(-)